MGKRKKMQREVHSSSSGTTGLYETRRVQYHTLYLQCREYHGTIEIGQDSPSEDKSQGGGCSCKAG